MHDWLRQAAGGIASMTGRDAAAYELTEAEIASLLELARLAAHESGERTNAPLLTYLAGLARGRDGLELDEIIATRPATTSRDRAS
jgi:Domain of unknown function (DUF6457)